jgi:hypothetical protein
MSDPIKVAKQEIERAQQTVEEVKAEVAKASADLAGGPASDPEQAAQQVADLRARLDRDLQTLRGRVPDPREIGERAKRTAIAVGGGIAALVAAIVLLKRRGATRRHEKAVEEQASAIASELLRLQADRLARANVSSAAVDEVVERVVDEVVDEDEGRGRTGRLLLLAGLAAGVGVALATRRRPTDDWDPVDAAVPGPPIS